MKHFKIILNSRQENLDLVMGCVGSVDWCGTNDNNNQCLGIDLCSKDDTSGCIGGDICIAADNSMCVGGDNCYNGDHSGTCVIQDTCFNSDSSSGCYGIDTCYASDTDPDPCFLLDICISDNGCPFDFC